MLIGGEAIGFKQFVHDNPSAGLHTISCNESTLMALNLTESPGHITGTFAIVKPGLSNAVTFMDSDPVHPLASATSTEYIPVDLTVSVDEFAPFIGTLSLRH